MDQKQVLKRLQTETWDDGGPGGETWPECIAKVQIMKGAQFEDCKFPPRKPEGDGTYDPFPQLSFRVRVLEATNPACRGTNWIRLDYPEKGYPGITPEQIEYRVNTVVRCLASALAPTTKGSDAKRAEYERILNAVDWDLSTALTDKTVLVKVTQYESANGPRNRFNQWYPDTPEMVSKYMTGKMAAAATESVSTDV